MYNVITCYNKNTGFIVDLSKMTKSEKKAYQKAKEKRKAEREKKRKEKYGEKYEEMVEKHKMWVSLSERYSRYN